MVRNIFSKKSKSQVDEKVKETLQPTYNLFSTETGYTVEDVGGLQRFEEIATGSTRQKTVTKMQERYGLKGLSFSSSRIFVEAESIEDARTKFLEQNSRKFTEEDLSKFTFDVFLPIVKEIEKKAEEKIEGIRKSVKDESEIDRQIAEVKRNLEENLAKYRVPKELEKALVGKTIYEAVFGLNIDYEKAVESLH